MSRRRPRVDAAVTISAWVASLALSPAIVIFGEPMRRLAMRRLRSQFRPLSHRPGSTSRALAYTERYQDIVISSHMSLRPRALFLHTLMFSPISIALTAPGRWVGGWLAKLGHFPGARRFGGRGPRPPDGGVREPRRPKPSPPVGAVELPEPR
jgi:hypothetical protein